ncbi:MAG: hypothetical protein JSS91_00390 [Bacteroidetes bacterium]|nr:hypothetical protein [Bacteroidota bacterium]
MSENEELIVSPNKELDHLIKLLDDEDDNIYSSVKERFLSFGNQSEDFLKNYLNDKNILINKRANEIVSILNFKNLEKKFFRLNPENKDFLEEAVFLISSYGYPGIDAAHYRNMISDYAAVIRLNIIKKFGKADPENPLDYLETINDFLFKDKMFRGNNDNYYDPDNSFLNKVIDNKTGIPITLSVIYLLVSRKLNLPVYGINMPGHFLLKYEKEKVEYYIDPFNGGIIISGPEAERFAKNLGIQKSDFDKIPYLNKTTDLEIILRILRNLIEIYKKEEELKASQIDKLMNSLVR